MSTSMQGSVHVLKAQNVDADTAADFLEEFLQEEASIETNEEETENNNPVVVGLFGIREVGCEF